MTEYNSFLEVKPGEDVRVKINDKAYELGEVTSIYATSSEYIVWLDKHNVVWYEVINTNTTTKTQDFHQFWNLYQSARSSDRQNLNISQQKTVLDFFGGAISSAIEGQYTAATQSIKIANSFIDTINTRIANKLYLSGVLRSSAIASVIGVILYSTYYFANVDQVIQICAHALCGGAVGTILSTTTGKIDDSKIDPNASKEEGKRNGELRVLYAFCGALVAMISFKLGLIDSKLISTQNERFAYFLIAVVGGFAERFAPNILSGVAKTKDDK